MTPRGRTPTGWLALGSLVGCLSDPGPVTGDSDASDGSSGTTAPITATASSTTTITPDDTTGSTGADVTSGPGPTTTATEDGESTAGSVCGDCRTGHCLDDACARWIFVTSASYPSDFQAGEADALCTTEADAGGLEGTFAAFLRDEMNDAFTRAQIDALPGAVFVLPDARGTVVAFSPEQLHFDTNPILLEHAIDVDAFGRPVIPGESTACAATTDRVWTGYREDEDGAAPFVEEAGTCTDWTAVSNGGTGRFSVASGYWVGGASCPCIADAEPARAHLYCVQVP